ncbi:Alpha amylase, catalytic domain, partial [Rhizoctonia solani]
MRPSRLFSLVLTLVSWGFVSALVVDKRQSLPTSEVKLQSYTLNGNSFSGSIYIKNIAYQKVVTVIYSNAANSWVSGQSVSASYSGSISGSNYETWTFSGTIGSGGIKQFYIRYDVSGTSYYDNNGTKNYDVGTTTTTTTAPSTTTTRVTTTAATTTTTAITTSRVTTTTSVATTLTSTVSTSYIPTPSNIPPELTPCNTWNGQDACSGSQVEYPASWDDRKWQTPSRGTSAWSSGFQDYRELTGYVDIVYNSARTSATVTVKANSRTGVALSYSFNGGAFGSGASATVTSSFTGPYAISVKDANGATLAFDATYFVWDAPAVNRPETNGGQKVAIVELFGWPYADIEKECVFLGKAGYGGVRIWPPSEAVTSDWWPQSNELNPWWFVYQPVSYRLISRHGTLAQLRSMITTCRANGVRVYADAVVNHMSGGGNDIQNHRGSGSAPTCGWYGPKNGTAGSPFFTHTSTYQYNTQTGLRPAMEYPAVPYSPTDFHCDRSLNSFTDGFILNYGWLVGLSDLNTEKPYVQERIATYFATLLSVGFSGFRIDAAKHMGPKNIAQILARLKTKMGGSLPPDFITWLEIILGGEKDLLACSYNDYNWYQYFNEQMSAAGLSSTEIGYVKIWSSDYPKGSVLIKDKNIATHRNFEVQLFTQTGFNANVRNILSSYSFRSNGAKGFPDGYSDCSRFKGTGTCISMPYSAAYNANACGYSVAQGGSWTEGVYTRVHRDMSIVNAMRGWMGLGSTTASAVGLPSGCT